MRELSGDQLEVNWRAFGGHVEFIGDHGGFIWGELGVVMRGC